MGDSILTHGKIVGVQYLRGIAVLAVAFDHGSFLVGHPFRWLEFGRHGVDLFFLISGFIIAAVSLAGPDLAPAIGVRAFLVRRFIRIVPLMWVAVAAFVLFSVAGIRGWPPVSFLTGVVLWPSGQLAPAHLWTLRQEAVFYALFAASMLTGKRWRFLLLLWLFAPPVIGLFYHGLWRGVWAVLLSPVRWEFIAGLAAAVLWFRYTRERRIRLPIDPLFVLAVLSGIALWGIIPVFHIRPGLTMALLCLPILLLAIHAECPPGPARAFGELLGNASYSIYLFHILGISAALRIWAALAPGAPIWMVVLSGALVGIALGVVLHLLVERPLVAWLRHRFAGPRAVQTEPQAAH
jgi:exopolysaccharide production protein ExoZ